jgi:hypothetical protein
MRNHAKAILWVATLIAIAFLVIITVNFRFQEDLLKKELIEHVAITVGKENICICPLCKNRGLAYCMHCGTPMNWDKLNRRFACPACRKVGHPQCPKCSVVMFGEEANKQNRNIVTGSPIPVF